MATIQDILNANTYHDLFPQGLDHKTAQKRYKRLQRIAHPDINQEHVDLAEKAFKHLTLLWENHVTKPGAKQTKGTVTTRKHTYLFTTKQYSTEKTTYYNATYDDGHETTSIAVTRNPQDNGTFLNNMKIVNKIRKETDPALQGFFPTITDLFTFTNRDKTHAGATLQTEEPFNTLYNLKQVLKKYPNGINAKDTAWIYRRMLIVLSETHHNGYVHNNPTMDAYLIHPARHGLVLTEWAHMKPVDPNEKITTPKKDIVGAATLALELTNPTSSPRFYNALKGVTQYPPQDADTALEELKELTRELWGQPTWHEFKM